MGRVQRCGEYRARRPEVFLHRVTAHASSGECCGTSCKQTMALMKEGHGEILSRSVFFSSSFTLMVSAFLSCFYLSNELVLVYLI